MIHTNEVLGQNVRYCRKVKGLTIEQLALAAEIGHAHLGKIERGVCNPTLLTMDRLAQALGITPAALLEFPPANVGGSTKS